MPRKLPPASEVSGQVRKLPSALRKLPGRVRKLPFGLRKLPGRVRKLPSRLRKLPGPVSRPREASCSGPEASSGPPEASRAGPEASSAPREASSGSRGRLRAPGQAWPPGSARSRSAQRRSGCDGAGTPDSIRLSEAMAVLLGADGCGRDWLVVRHDTATSYTSVFLSATPEFAHLDFDVLAIDIPIGLPEAGQASSRRASSRPAWSAAQ